MKRIDVRTTGVLFAAFTVGNLVATTLLSVSFGWPAVLDEPAAVALPAFAAAQVPVVAGFVLFTALSVALIPISLGVHQLVAERVPADLGLMSVTAFGILSGFAQILGWIRWPLVVPDLASTWLDPGSSPELRVATEASYALINSYAGGALGEYLGWLLQALWAVGIAILLARSSVIGRKFATVGLVLTAAWAASFLLGPAVPILAQGIVGIAAFAAYGLWFFWLGAVGVQVLRQSPDRALLSGGVR